jgi:cell division protease FtsH
MDDMSEHLNIQITSLPERLSYDEAVEAAYREDLDWIEGKLRARLSVLIECDKQLSNYIYKALRKRFRSGGDIRLRLLSGHPRQQQPDEAMAPQQSLTQRLLDELREAIYNATDQNILTMTHLDILTTTTRSSLGVEAREAAAIMYENPDLVFLGFTDPEFEIPPVIEKVFAVKHEIAGISRDTLPSLILRKRRANLGWRSSTHLNSTNLSQDSTLCVVVKFSISSKIGSTSTPIFLALSTQSTKTSVD